MKNSLFFLLLFVVAVQSCTNNANKDGFIALKPGQYCKVGSVTVIDGTIYIGGSFIKVDNPNTTAPLRQSYIASVDTSGKINWERYIDSPDYIHWEKLIASNRDILYALGTKSSPLSSQLVTLASLDHYNPELYADSTFIDTLPNVIVEAHANASGYLAFNTLELNQTTGYSCLKYKQIEPICGQGTLNCLMHIGDDKYISAWGTPSKTETLYYINDTVSIDTISIPDSLDRIMVNGITTTATNNYLLATTIKNGQGPCIHQLGGNMDFTKQLCLGYWPMHGSVIMKELGNCTVLAFNATDDVKGNYVQLVIVNSNNDVVFEETIEAQNRFVLSDITLNQANIYLAGTMEIDGEGSSMAIKTIPVPANANCISKN